MTYNTFEEFADAVKPYWQKKKEATVAKAKLRRERIIEVFKERDELLRIRKLFIIGHYEKLLEGHYGDTFRNIEENSNNSSINDFAKIKSLFENLNTTTLKNAPNDIRYDIMSIVGDWIIKVRLKAKLPEFDDPMPDQPDNAFIILKRIILNE